MNEREIVFLRRNGQTRVVLPAGENHVPGKRMACTKQRLTTRNLPSPPKLKLTHYTGAPVDTVPFRSGNDPEVAHQTRGVATLCRKFPCDGRKLAVPARTKPVAG